MFVWTLASFFSLSVFSGLVVLLWYLIIEQDDLDVSESVIQKFEKILQCTSHFQAPQKKKSKSKLSMNRTAGSTGDLFSQTGSIAEDAEDEEEESQAGYATPPYNPAASPVCPPSPVCPSPADQMFAREYSGLSDMVQVTPSNLTAVNASMHRVACPSFYSKPTSRTSKFRESTERMTGKMTEKMLKPIAQSVARAIGTTYVANEPDGLGRPDSEKRKKWFKGVKHYYGFWDQSMRGAGFITAFWTVQMTEFYVRKWFMFSGLVLSLFSLLVVPHIGFLQCH